VVFILCYFGTLAIIGLSAKEGGYYSPFVSNYLNYVGWVRESLLYASKFLLGLFGVDTYLTSQYNLRMVNGSGIVIVYECVGYGIMSFWTAFLVASPGGFKRKLLWWAAGIILFWLLNIIRLSLLLVATNKNWPIPFGWDHHTWFNIIAYAVVLIMIYYFDKQNGKIQAKKYARE
jgi:exosortase/archaeosortase family protein